MTSIGVAGNFKVYTTHLRRARITEKNCTVTFNEGRSDLDTSRSIIFCICGGTSSIAVETTVNGDYIKYGA